MLSISEKFQAPLFRRGFAVILALLCSMLALTGCGAAGESASATPTLPSVNTLVLAPAPGDATPLPDITSTITPTLTATATPVAFVEPDYIPAADLMDGIFAARLVASTPTTTFAFPTVAAPTRSAPVRVGNRLYDAYLPAAFKKKQWFQYTCEFDSAWVVLKSYGYDVSLEKQIELIGLDRTIEPTYRLTRQGYVIYGGDVTKAYSGDYKKNFLARSTGQAMRKVFDGYGLKVTLVNNRPGLEAALLRGELVWIKTTVDFKPWKPAKWVMPDGRSYMTVLGNDHAAVVMGFNKDVVVIRDVLGPTSTNRQRKYEYEVKWSTFLGSWGAQGFDGLAVAPPKR